MASWTPSLVSPATGAERVALGHRLVDDYLEVVRARCRCNTVWATAYDLKVFFTVVAKDPVEVTVADVLGFIRSQRSSGGARVVRLADGGSGLALSTVRRRLSTVSGFYGYLVALGVVDVNPVLRGMAARSCARSGATGSAAGAPGPPSAPGVDARRGERPGGRAAPVAGSGHDRSDAAGRAAPQRGPRSAARGSRFGATAGVRRRRQGRSPTVGADLERGSSRR